MEVNKTGRPDPKELGFNTGYKAAKKWYDLSGNFNSPFSYNEELRKMPSDYIMYFYEGVIAFRNDTEFNSKQSKFESFIEACVSTVVGFCVTVCAYPVINYFCDVKMSASQVAASTVLFTVLSVIRGYVIRRFFNNLSGVKKFFVKLFLKKK